MVTKTQLSKNTIKDTIGAVLRGNAAARIKLQTDKPKGGFQLKIPVFPLHASECRYPQKVKKR